MKLWKRLLLASVLAAIHLLVLAGASYLQSVSLLFWPSLALRTLALVLAAPALGLRGLMDLKLGMAVPSWLCFWISDLVLLYLMDKLRAVRKVLRSPTVRSRRILFAGTGVALVGATGVARETTQIEVRQRNLPLKDLPPELSGLRIALLADLHRGPAVSQGFLEEVLERVNSLKPDIILMPGDFVSKSRSYYQDLEIALSRLSPTIGSFATLGNHDIWEGREEAMAALSSAGVHTLQNRSLFLSTQRQLSEQPNGGLCLAGVDDLWSGEPDLKLALESVPQNIPVILLSHNPDLAESDEAKDFRVDLQVSGHTHGGQIVLPGIGALATASRYGTKYLSGWNEGPYWPVYTTVGVGTSSIPVRVGASPEIVVFTAMASC